MTRAAGWWIAIGMLVVSGGCTPSTDGVRSSEAGASSGGSASSVGAVPPAKVKRPRPPAVVETLPEIEVAPHKFLKTEELLTFPPGALELVVEPRQPAVLPFQAAVVRVSLVNRSQEVIGPVNDLLSTGIDEGKPAKDKTYRSADLPRPEGPAWQRNGLTCFMLRPGQRLTIDCAFGRFTEHRSFPPVDRKQVRETVISPIFFEESERALEVNYAGRVWSHPGDDIRTPFKLRRAEPAGDDRLVFERLKADPTLARCMYDNLFVPEPKHIAPLEDLLKTWPKSSYADYVRLALVRARIGAWGKRIPRASPLPPVLPTQKQLDNPDRESRPAVTKNLSPLLPPAERERVSAAFSKADSRSIRERFVAGARASTELTANDRQRREALDLLEAVNLSTFAYASHALVLKNAIFAIDEPDRLGEVTDEFLRERPFSREWLTLLIPDYGSSMPDDGVQAWVEYRIRRSHVP